MESFCSSLTDLLSSKDLPREELASMCARCERYVGVQGGGMDQAICLLAEKGAAKLIEFEPKLKAETVLLPEDAVFVVANSCVEINKGNTSHYNTRVVECRLAAQVNSMTGLSPFPNYRAMSILGGST